MIIKQIVKAIREGNLSVIQKHINRSNINRKLNKIGETALHIAVTTNHLEIVDYLISQNASFNIVPKKGPPPLIKAIFHGHPDGKKLVAQRLLEAGTYCWQKTLIKLIVFEQDEIFIEKINADPLLLTKTDGARRSILHYIAALGAVHILSGVSKHLTPALINIKNKSGFTPLVYAAMNDSCELVSLFLEKGADITAQNKQGWNALLCAAEHGQLAVIQLLLSKGADIDYVKKDKLSAIHIAAARGHLTVVKSLLAMGASPQPSLKGFNLLMQAAKYEDVALVRDLITLGIDVNAQTNHGWTALSIAAEHGQLKNVELLVEAGASIEHTTNFGATPVMVAAAHGHSHVVNYLLDRGVIFDHDCKDGFNLLIHSAKWENTVLIERLLSLGLDVNHASEKGWSGLLVAAERGHLESVKLLLRQNADISHQNIKGNSAALEAAKHGYTEIIHYLLDEGAPVDVTAVDNHNLLTRSSAWEDTELIQRLLSLGLDANHETKNGWTPLLVAAEHGQIGIIKILLAQGANVNYTQRDIGNTPALLSAEKGYVEVVKYLLGKGADYNSICKVNGCNLLHYAAKQPDEEFVLQLLQNGLDVNYRSKKGNTALFIAICALNFNIADLLVAHGANLDKRCVNLLIKLSDEEFSGNKCSPLLYCIDHGAVIDSAYQAAILERNQDVLYQLLVLGSYVQKEDIKHDIPIISTMARDLRFLVSEIIGRIGISPSGSLADYLWNRLQYFCLPDLLPHYNALIKILPEIITNYLIDGRGRLKFRISLSNLIQSNLHREVFNSIEQIVQKDHLMKRYPHRTMRAICRSAVRWAKDACWSGSKLTRRNDGIFGFGPSLRAHYKEDVSDLLVQHLERFFSFHNIDALTIYHLSEHNKFLLVIHLKDLILENMVWRSENEIKIARKIIDAPEFLNNLLKSTLDVINGFICERGELDAESSPDYQYLPPPPYDFDLKEILDSDDEETLPPYVLNSSSNNNDTVENVFPTSQKSYSSSSECDRENLSEAFDKNTSVCVTRTTTTQQILEHGSPIFTSTSVRVDKSPIAPATSITLTELVEQAPTPPNHEPNVTDQTNEYSDEHTVPALS